MTHHSVALETPPSYSQAVDHSASLPPIVLLLPLLQPSDHFEQRALGGGCVPVGRPANVLEVLDYTIAILWLRRERLLGLFCWGCLGIQALQIPWRLQHCSGRWNKKWGLRYNVLMGRVTHYPHTHLYTSVHIDSPAMTALHPSST